MQQGVDKIGQPNLMCATCYLGAYYGIICAAGYNPDTCANFVQAYTCKGGLVFARPITKEQCYKCGESCTGCMRMSVAYGFAKIEDVGHLI